jgi:hypothetical protein
MPGVADPIGTVASHWPIQRVPLRLRMGGRGRVHFVATATVAPTSATLSTWGVRFVARASVGGMSATKCTLARAASMPPFAGGNEAIQSTSAGRAQARAWVVESTS